MERGAARLSKIQRIKDGLPVRVIDLFAGCGGFSLGFAAAGFDIVGAVEIDALAARSHALNFCNGERTRSFEQHALPRDIVETEPEDLVRDLCLGKVTDAADVIIGGPPCQAFARVGRAKLREIASHAKAFLKDGRSNLYLRFLHYVDRLKPLALVMENVPDALNYGGHNIAEEMCEVLDDMGYVPRYTLLNSVFYGVPQMRERMFLIAYARELGVEVRFPNPTHWIALPTGYEGSRSVALKTVGATLFENSFYVSPPGPAGKVSPAVTAWDALHDLPSITNHLNGGLKRGARRFDTCISYPDKATAGEYARLMREWPGFENSEGLRDHVIRSLPREANVETLGAAPLAIRVGSYVVIPGDTSYGRERFNFQIQLVDDLYESSSTSSGVYEDVFEDTAKLRDAARICCEISGMVSLTIAEGAPQIALLHGPLVNPVSPYALGKPGESGCFPNFTDETLRKFLPSDTSHRTGREANFVSVYLKQLNNLQTGKAAICGVVERPSSAAPGPFVRKLLERLYSDSRIDANTYHQFVEKMGAYRITDSVIFECVLEEAEFVAPLEMDKQEPHHKIPDPWRPEILSYPKPLLTYVKANAETMPLRVESFPSECCGTDQLMKLIVHMSRLLPRYSFPVGLDIVDKHAKVPEWMSRQMNAMLSAQLMRKAMEAGNPAGIRLVRRILSANTRDWLFRPDFRKN